MAVQRRMRVLSWQLAWMLVIILVLSALNAFSYELFFVLSVLGFVLVIDLTRPMTVRPGWRLRLRLILFLGLIGFALVIGLRIVEMIGVGIGV